MKSLLSLIPAMLTQSPDGVLHVGSDLTSWDPVFKDDYSNTRIINSLNEENQILNFMTTDTSSDGWQGRQKIVPVKVGRNWSIGSIPSKGPLPNAGRSS